MNSTVAILISLLGLRILLDAYEIKKFALLPSILFLTLLSITAFYKYCPVCKTSIESIYWSTLLQSLELTNTASSISLLTLLLFCIAYHLQRTTTCKEASQIIFHSITLITLTVIIGYVFQVSDLTSFAFDSSMSLSTAILVFIGSIAITFNTPQHGLQGLFFSKGLGGMIARRVLPQLILLVSLVVTVIILLYKRSVITAEIAAAMLGLGALTLSIVILWINARSFNVLDSRRAHAQKQLKKLNEQLERLVLERTAKINAILNIPNVAIIVTNEKGIITSFSNGAERMLGYTAEEVIGIMSTTALVGEAAMNQQGGVEHLIEEAKHQQTNISQWTYIAKDGHLIPVQISVSVINDENGAFLGFVGIAQDISELKQKESELNAISKSLELKNSRLLEFAHITSHDLRAPARNLQALLFLQKEEKNEDEKKQLQEKFGVVVNELNDVLEELINVVQGEEMPDKNIRNIEIKEILNKVISMQSADMITGQVTIETDTSPLEYIQFNYLYLESILSNLISNAIKYRSPDRACIIKIQTGLADHRPYLRVSDNGLGIDMEKYGNKVFGLRKTFHNHPDAKGVGLYLVRSQVESLGGTIQVESQVNQGTTFTIYFNTPQN